VSKVEKEGKTVKDLRAVAEALGYEGLDEVKRVLSVGGLGGGYQPALWDDYVAHLTVHSQMVERLACKIEELERKRVMGPCPVCGEQAIWSNGRGMLPTEWICEAGGKSHYWYSKVNGYRERDGLPPLDYIKLEEARKERQEQDEFQRKNYWKYVYGELEGEELKKFETIFYAGKKGGE
jgi:predicted RNA-binding Zn-ribbon protein involved in translation (DUF1610 family)